MADTQEDLIKAEVIAALDVERAVAEAESQLMLNDQFRAFITRQKEAKQQIEDTWAMVEQQMIEHNIKSIKGDFGSLTIAERTSFDVDMDVLPDKFKKTVADTRRIGDTFKLEGEAPEGATPKYTKYLTKRLK